MSHPEDRRAATGLLDDLDDIRSLLDDQSPDDIPVLEDAVELADAEIPLLDDPIAPDMDEVALFDDAISLLPEAESFAEQTYQEVRVAPASREPSGSLTDGGTITEALVSRGLETAIRARIDATLEHWVNETLQVELALLRARLQEAVRAEVETFITDEINRSIVTGKPHGQ